MWPFKRRRTPDMSRLASIEDEETLTAVLESYGLSIETVSEYWYLTGIAFVAPRLRAALVKFSALGRDANIQDPAWQTSFLNLSGEFLAVGQELGEEPTGALGKRVPQWDLPHRSLREFCKVRAQEMIEFVVAIRSGKAPKSPSGEDMRLFDSARSLIESAQSLPPNIKKLQSRSHRRGPHA